MDPKWVEARFGYIRSIIKSTMIITCPLGCDVFQVPTCVHPNDINLTFQLSFSIPCVWLLVATE